VRLAEAFIYLAVVLDAFSRKAVGWAMADHLRASLALDALEMALASREVVAGGLVHHSDRGVPGGLEWSSQHLDGGDCDGHSEGVRIGRGGARCGRQGGRGWRGARTGGGFGR